MFERKAICANCKKKDSRIKKLEAKIAMLETALEEIEIEDHPLAHYAVFEIHRIARKALEPR